MEVGYVVLYVDDAEACRDFWVGPIGMVEKRRYAADGFTIVQVGFADQSFALELVPLALMKDNPDGLDLATPSMAFRVSTTCTRRTRRSPNGAYRRPKWATIPGRRASPSPTRRGDGSPSRSE